MKKKKKESVVLNPTALMPTTIGTLNNRQGSPFVVIFIIIIFVAGIFSLDYIVAWLNPETEITPYIPSPSNPNNNPNNNNEDDKSENKKYDITNDLAFSMGTITFKDFVIDTSINTISFNAVTSGTSVVLTNHNYYLELYSSSDILLQRIKLPNESIVETRNFSFDITKSLSTGEIVKLGILEIKDEDYNNITLTKKIDNQSVLICSLNNLKVEYRFANNANTYSLERIISTNQITETDSEYDSLLEKYEELNDKLDGVDGIEISLNPARGGFEAVINVDLNTVKEDVYQRNLKDAFYYKKATPAKKISFELSSSGYTCE